MTVLRGADPGRNAFPSALAGRVRGLLLAALFFSFFANALLLTGPLFMLQVYDRVLASRSQETLVALFALVAVLSVFYGLLEYARALVVSRIGARISEALAAPLFHAVVVRAASGGAGTGASHRDLDAAARLFSSPVMLALLDIPWTPFFLAAIFVFHPVLGWLALAGGSVLVCAALLNQLLTSRTSAEAGAASRAADRLAGQAEGAGAYLAAQGMAPAMLERWTDLRDRALVHAMGTVDRTGAVSSFVRAFRLFLQSAMLAAGAWFVLVDELTAGAMIAASILLTRALAPVEIGVSQWPAVQRARAGWRNVEKTLGEAPCRGPVTTLPAPTARLDVERISFHPGSGERPILHRVSFNLRPGRALGVIGRSGSGKTTLARIVTGQVAPTAGEVRLAGATLDQYGAARLGAFIGYLPQEVQFFDGTVAENIARMAGTPDDTRVVAAARAANVHEVVLSLPDGYDTRLSGSELTLSGGQRQRLALARALYGDPVLLVLDEPSSALDTDGSEALNAAVRRMKDRGRAVLIMTHRPTAISTCDDLLVLDGGRAARFGPREEIVAAMMKNAGDVRRAVRAATA
jgi:ATP-binding cassette subfamily C protein